jgi:hypothetical protein
MLFDLRGAGRQRTVKAVYITLALLMGGGLVLFGIGGGGALSGGLLDAITSSNNSGSSGSDRFEQQEAAATAKARANPNDAAAWAAVARARFNLANSGDNVADNGASFTDAGKAQLAAASRAWEKHVSVAGDNPDPRVASLMVQAYAALNQLGKATDAQSVIAQDRKSAGAYATLAQLAYQAGRTRIGDLATKTALAKTPADERESLKGTLEAAKSSAASAAGTSQSP